MNPSPNNEIARDGFARDGFARNGLARDEVAVIIPARMASIRLPGKPLAMLGDAPMIVHVLGRATAAGLPAIVATEDKEIADVVRKAGGMAVMTRPDHPSGSDRIAEALDTIDPGGKIKIAVNVQGDLPELDGGILPQLVDALVASGADIATPVAPCAPDEVNREQVVKAVIAFDGAAAKTGATGRVLYFSRAPVPFGDAPHWHHIGIYAWRRDALTRFVTLPPSPLEQSERLEQLRALEDGMGITALVVDSTATGIDTADDLRAAEARFARKRSKGK